MINDINLGLKYLNDLIHTQAGEKTSNCLMYIDFNYSVNPGDFLLDEKLLRKLKVDRLIDGVDHTEEIKSLQTKVDYNRQFENEIEVMAPSIKTHNITLNKKLKLTDDFNISELGEHLRREALNEIYRLSSLNRHIHINQLPDLSFTLAENLDTNYCAKKIVLKINNCSAYIAMNSRIGRANSVIIHPKIFKTLVNTNMMIVTNDNKYKVGTLSGLDVFIDDSIGDKIVVFRRASDSQQLGNDVISVYNIEDDFINYSITHIGNCETNYIEFEVNVLDI